MTEMESLKCFGQCPTRMQALAKSKRIWIALWLSKITFKCTHVMWSGPGDDRLEHDAKASVRSLGPPLRGTLLGTSGSQPASTARLGRLPIWCYINPGISRLNGSSFATSLYGTATLRTYSAGTLNSSKPGSWVLGPLVRLCSAASDASHLPL